MATTIDVISRGDHSHVGPVARNGVVYEKDLGPETLALAGAIDRFNPEGVGLR